MALVEEESLFIPLTTAPNPTWISGLVGVIAGKEATLIPKEKQAKGFLSSFGSREEVI